MPSRDHRRRGWLGRDVQRHGDTVLAMPDPTERTVAAACGIPRSRARELAAWAVKRGRKAEREPVKGRTHLVIGDCHALPGEDPRRFRWLGKMVADLVEQGGQVVCLGDFNDYASLCGAAPLSERIESTLKAEQEAEEIAADEYHRGLGVPNANDSGIAHAALPGNHDVRPERLAEDAPWFEGLIEPLASLHARGWTVGKYLDPMRIDGVAYVHFWPNVMGRAVSSKVYPARALLLETQFAESITVGHSHVLSYLQARRQNGSAVHALSAGCFFEADHAFARGQNRVYWRGIVVKRNVANGDYDAEFWSLDRIKRRYA